MEMRFNPNERATEEEIKNFAASEPAVPDTTSPNYILWRIDNANNPLTMYQAYARSLPNNSRTEADDTVLHKPFWFYPGDEELKLNLMSQRIKQGEDILATNEINQTPLHIAARCGCSPKMFDLLVKESQAALNKSPP